MSSSICKAASEIVIRGQSASPGIAFGTVVRPEDARLQFNFSHIAADEVPAELKRLYKGLAKARRQLNILKERMAKELGQEHAYILDAQILMLQDSSLFESVERIISEKLVNAEWAIKLAIEPFLAAYASISDGYLRERGSDIEDVANRLMRVIAGKRRSRSALKSNSILVSDDLPPSIFAELKLSQLAGIATSSGGWASHTSIIARGLRIPCVVGLGSITELCSGQSAIIDGSEGLIVVNPTEATIDHFRELSQQRKRSFHALLAQSKYPAITADGKEIKLRANIELPSEVSSVTRFGAQGIGLFRSEYLYLNMLPQARSEEGQYEIYSRLVDVCGKQPVTIRTFDLGPVAFDAEPEPNPALGLRGIRLLLRYKDLLNTQLRAILRVSSKGNIRVLLPMVSQVDEVLTVRKTISELSAKLQASGTDCSKHIPLGIMVEVPATVIILDRLLPYVDFVNIGTNDLVQYLLAVDRDNQSVSSLYLPLHLSVLRAIKHIVDTVRSANKAVEVCGEMACSPVGSAALLAVGVETLSVTPSAIPVLKDAIRHLHLAKLKELLDEIKNIDDPLQAERCFVTALQSHSPGFLDAFKLVEPQRR
ncbi:MAG: phosphoenolpyruvate--protein phosphotransferase [Acidobacteriota bacterium]|nr:phosphoenolpyruvate--protein phosphotransferase [Blastocatellia bacterium]MDW8413173.1 phosphoenolpyruvate--protein phosphotransferase [Acidobacteriota bacterium]